MMSQTDKLIQRWIGYKMLKTFDGHRERDKIILMTYTIGHPPSIFL